MNVCFLPSVYRNLIVTSANKCVGFALLSVMLLIGTHSFGQKEDVLFKITRNKDANEVLYHLNYNSREEIDQSAPITGFWMRGEEGGRSRSLNFLERKYAYGLNFLESTDNKSWFQFVSYDKKDFYLKKDKRGEYGVYTDFEEGPMRIHNIYLHLKGGTFWLPKITQVDIHGTDQDGQSIERSVVNP